MNAMRFMGGLYHQIDWGYLHRDAHRRTFIRLQRRFSGESNGSFESICKKTCNSIGSRSLYSNVLRLRNDVLFTRMLYHPIIKIRKILQDWSKNDIRIRKLEYLNRADAAGNRQLP
jgi:hypothetical protein